MKKSETKYKKAVFHGFPDEKNVDIQNILSGIERTFLPIGSEIGRYKIIEEIDRGGMAVVYKALKTDIDRIVALKVLPANVTINHNFVERFLSEAHAVAKLQHPNIVNIYEVSVEENIYFLAMDYVPGKNLFYYLNQEKPKLVKVLEIVKQLSDALEYAHNQKILHRDLKLNNVIMKDDTTPVLIDFGLAKVIGGDDTNLTKTGEIIGSPAYMAPERIFGRGLDARSDICSLGIMLYEMLTFKNPYLDPRSMIQTTKNVIEASPVSPRHLVPWLPVEIESITLKAMKREPENRYQSMKKFGDDIQRYQKGEHVLASPPSLWSKLNLFTRKHWASLVISAISLLFTILLVIIISIQSGKEKFRWQLAFEEKFNNSESLENWQAFYKGKASAGSSNKWAISNGWLHAKAEGFTFFRLERLFTRDLRIEFDIKLKEKDVFNAGFFICGNSPDSGYCFWIHKDGSELNGITYPGIKFLFYDYNPVEFTVGSKYHAVIEKKNNIITFWLNDILISKINDFFPILDRNHQKFGLFVNGSSILFDNLTIYRRALPRLARPTIIADFFWKQGDFESALAEYKEVLLDLSRSDLVRHIKFKMVDCYIRLENFEEAEMVLADIENSIKSNDTDRAMVLFLWGMLKEKKNNSFEMNKSFISLARYFPSAPVNKSVATYMAIDCYNLFNSGKHDSAEAKVTLLTKKYPGVSYYFGRIHLDILRYFSTRGFWDKTQEIGNRIIHLHKKDNEILIQAKNWMAKTSLSKAEKKKATDILNQCVSVTDEPAAKWDAWMIIAETYEYNNKYSDAFAIYKKIYTDCPKSLPLPWKARIRMGELATLQQRLSPEKPASIFKSVSAKHLVFIEPWLIAQLYTGSIDNETFKKKWLLLHPDDPYYLYHFSFKAVIQNDYNRAIRYLNELRRSTSQYTWRYARIKSTIEYYKIIKRIK